MAFARTMGEPMEYPFLKGLPGHPEITQVAKFERERANFGGVWHSDTTYLEIPPMGSMLLAREVPAGRQGLQQLFANQYLAYEALSPGMQRMLAGLTGVSSSARADVTKSREDRIKSDGREEAQQGYLTEHPAVRTHPEIGRKSLFVNYAHTIRFKDMSEEESAPLLNYLFQHQIRPAFTCRLPGLLGTTAAPCTIQVNDYHGYRRVMHRITLAGDKPR